MTAGGEHVGDSGSGDGGLSLVQVLAALDALPAMVGYWDRELRNRLANRAYVEWFGRTPAQMRGMHIRDLLGERVYAANLPYMQKALAGQPQLFDRTLIDAAGRSRNTQQSYIPDQRDGEVHGFFVLTTDITRHVEVERQLRQGAEQYRALARSIPAGFVLLFDADLRFVIAEGEALGTFGYQRADLEGRTIYEAFPEEISDEVEARYRGALRGRRATWERRIGEGTFALTAGPVSDEDGVIGAGMVVALEVTERRQSEATWAALHEVATAVARSTAPLDVAQRIASVLRQIFQIDTAAVLRFTGTDEAEIVAMAPERPATLDPVMTFGAGDTSATALVARTGQPAWAPYEDSVGVVGEQMKAEGLRVGAAAPIHVRGTLWGAIGIASTSERGVSQGMLDRLSGFAELVAVAIGNAEAWSALAHEATTDSLTGLSNRRAFEEHLRREVARAVRLERPLSLIALDIDHFKKVNDTFGHPAGDRVMAEIAARLKAGVRAGEILGRMGGDEFVWLLPDADGEQASVAAERARRTIAELPFPGVGTVTVSVGICCWADVDSRDGLISSADAALYAAKLAGRNAIVHYARPAER